MKRNIAILIFIVCSIHLYAQLNINHYIRVGRTRIQIGNYVGAIEYFNIVIQFKPHLPEVYFYRGIAKLQLEDFRGAILDFDKSIAIKTYYPEGYMYRGLAHHNLSQFQKAIKDYDKALDMNLSEYHDEVLTNRGNARLSQRDVESAMEDYNKALEINPKSVLALINRSNAKIFSRDYAGAIQDLNQAIHINPRYAGAYLNRGLARYEQEDYANALKDFDRVIQLDPKNAMAYNNRGILKQKLGDHKGAMMDYELALEIDPHLANAYFNRAVVKEILQIHGYQKDYETAAILDPRFDFTHEETQQQATQNQGHISPTSSSKEKEAQRNRLKRRLAIADTRGVPKEDDGKTQNKHVVIELEPIFMIYPYDKKDVDYKKLQYYSQALEELNKFNNERPPLTIANKCVEFSQDYFEHQIRYFSDKIKKANSPAQDYLNRGIIKMLEQKYTEALKDIDKAITMDMHSELAYFTRANCKVKIVEKIQDIRTQTKDLTISLNPTVILEKEDENITIAIQEYQEIIVDYEQALSINKHFFFAYFNHGNISIQQGNFNQALQDYNKAIEIEPDFAEAYFNRGLAKIYLDNIEGGALDLSKAGELGIQAAYNIIKRYCN
jgi:tetratricopeptide (TPR) repeat protein